jgi:uncharacterized SAM-binding protein YcdF (DUF218 family)
VIWAYCTVPTRNNDDPLVDALLVLGTPTGRGGELTDPERWRIDEAVREYKAGRARNIVISGGPTSYGYVEARAMGQYAQSRGVPPEAVFEETHALTTLENIRNSQRILDAHGWRRVEVISSADHLPRAAVILQHTHLLWRVHASPTPGRSRLRSLGAYAEEAVGTTAIRLFGLGAEPVLHGFAEVQHRIWAAMLVVRDRIGGARGHR